MTIYTAIHQHRPSQTPTQNLFNWESVDGCAKYFDQSIWDFELFISLELEPSAPC